jgi:hypothetical protein
MFWFCITTIYAVIKLCKIEKDGQEITAAIFIITILFIALTVLRITTLNSNDRDIRMNLGYYYKYHTSFEKKPLDTLNQEEKDAIMEFNKID